MRSIPSTKVAAAKLCRPMAAADLGRGGRAKRIEEQ
jgi:hypothetical protein